MTRSLRFLFVVVIFLSVFLRLNSATSYRDAQFLDKIEGVVIAQGGAIIATRKKTQMHGFISFAMPSCPSTLSIIPMDITQVPEASLTVQGFADNHYSVAYLGYAGPYPGKFRLFFDFLLARITFTLGVGKQVKPTNTAVLIVGNGDCDLPIEFDPKVFWHSVN